MQRELEDGMGNNLEWLFNEGRKDGYKDGYRDGFLAGKFGEPLTIIMDAESEGNE